MTATIITNTPRAGETPEQARQRTRRARQEYKERLAALPAYPPLPPPSEKPSNPKDSVGIKKVPMSTVPAPVMAELGVAMLEGALKYGRHNYRVIGVRASVYYDATVGRHMQLWWEGEDIDPDSGLSHITKAIASLVVLRDAMIRGNWVDDRPPKSADGWMNDLNKKVIDLLQKYPDPKAAYTEAMSSGGQGE